VKISLGGFSAGSSLLYWLQYGCFAKINTGTVEVRPSRRPGGQKKCLPDGVEQGRKSNNCHIQKTVSRCDSDSSSKALNYWVLPSLSKGY